MVTEKIIGRKSNIIADQLNALTIIDKNDPLYNSESEDENCFYEIMDVAQYEKSRHLHASYSMGHSPSQPPILFDDFAVEASKIIQEYFITEDCNEVIRSLNELECEQFFDLFVVTAVRKALDQNNQKQKLTSGLLMLLRDRKVLTRQHMTRGFEKLVETIHDLKLDVPDAADRILTFIECATCDKCISEEYMKRLPENFLNEVSEETIEAIPMMIDHLKNLREYKGKMRDMIADIFNENIETIPQLVEDLGYPYFRHEFVRHLIIHACDKTDREREKASTILDELYGKTLCSDDMQIGFARLIGTVEDLQLDSPKGAGLLCRFLARSIVDDILPPSFLGDSYRLHLGGMKGMSVVKKTQKWLTQRKGKGQIERFRKIWTGRDSSTLVCQEFKKELRNTVIEYYDSHDKQEAFRLIFQMDLSPDQAVEMIRKIIVIGMERSDMQRSTRLTCFELLEYLLEQKEIDNDLLILGFLETKLLLPEISLDVPDAAKQLEYYIDQAVESNLLPADFRKKYNCDNIDDV